VRVTPGGRELAELVEALPSGRFVLGISGAPGAGKSTVATALATAYGVPVVPMDGFHRRDAELVAMGRREAKGAPDTFDAEGYAALLRRLHAGGEVRAPSFDHGQPDPRPDTIRVPREAGLVVTEGNYLLLEAPEWRAVRRELDAVWHVTVPDDVRVERLVRRHVAAGRTLEDARAWVARVDQANAALVEAAAGRAGSDVTVVDVSSWDGRLSRR
jgi:pantothenate kinase